MCFMNRMQTSAQVEPYWIMTAFSKEKQMIYLIGVNVDSFTEAEALARQRIETHLIPGFNVYDAVPFVLNGLDSTKRWGEQVLDLLVSMEISKDLLPTMMCILAEGLDILLNGIDEEVD